MASLLLASSSSIVSVVGGGASRSSSSSSSTAVVVQPPQPPQPPLRPAPVLPSLRTNRTSTFPINEECTSITMTTSGNIIVAGFTDGTIRLFDRTGTFLTAATTSSSDTTSSSPSTSSSSSSSSSIVPETTVSASEDEQEFETVDDLDSISNDDTGHSTKRRKNKSSTFVEVNSSYHQRYGAVACQIYAKGVHTALRLDCTITDDDQYCFASVLRGNMECVAIHIGPLEELICSRQQQQQQQLDTTRRTSFNNLTTPRQHEMVQQKHNKNLLDYVHVHRHSDAKLRGLGACIRLASTSRNQYLLLTGKSIKNIHIWSFQPPSPSTSSMDDGEPTWQCLYDCPTNGNTIQWLAFRRVSVSEDDTSQPPVHKLQAISKSLHQKLRVWDISQEDRPEMFAKDDVPGKPQTESQESFVSVVSSTVSLSSTTSSSRPNRPPYKDILNTECALGIAGNWIICGGELFDNQISIVSLDTSSSSSVYNHTELALPASSSLMAHTTATSITTDQRRQQRGDMKCVVSVSGIENHAVLELSDGSVAEYRVISDDNENANTTTTKTGMSSGITMIHSIEKLPDSTCTRQLSVHQIAESSTLMLSNTNTVVAVVAAYQPILGRGTITVQPITQPYVAAGAPSTAMKSCRTIQQKENVTPIPVHNLKATSMAMATIEQGISEPHQDTIHVVTTVKKQKQRSGGYGAGGAQLLGQPALVTTVKKKKETKTAARKRAKTDELYASESSILSVPKKKRIKIAAAVMSSTTPNTTMVASKASDETALSVFSTPFPKPVVTSSTTHTNQSDSTNDDNNNNVDNYLATIYENAPPTLSVTKQCKTMPSTWIDEESKATQFNGGVTHPVDGTSTLPSESICVSESSPPIPRKRVVLTSSEIEQPRRVSLSSVKATASNEQTPCRDVTCHIPATTQLQNITAKIVNNSPKSLPVMSSSNKPVSKSSLVNPDVSKDGRLQPTTAKATPPVKEIVPIINTREHITALCNEKLYELETFEGQVDIAPRQCALSVHASSKPYDNNPYDKKLSMMMAHHYACHVQMRKRMIDATRATIYSIMDAPIVSSLDKARGFLYSALLSYQDLTSGMIQLQRVEAYTLIALKKRHSSNHFSSHDAVGTTDAGEDEIAFSFPTVFQDVMTFLPGME